MAGRFYSHQVLSVWEIDLIFMSGSTQYSFFKPVLITLANGEQCNKLYTRTKSIIRRYIKLPLVVFKFLKGISVLMDVNVYVHQQVAKICHHLKKKKKTAVVDSSSLQCRTERYKRCFVTIANRLLIHLQMVDELTDK